MRHTCVSNFAFLLAAGLLLGADATVSPAQQSGAQISNHSVNRPETLGFSSDRLERLHAVMQQKVDEKQLAGIVTILARHGKVVEERTYGTKDIASGAPMTKDKSSAFTP